ncbi:MAG: tetratricopeptide repeat protein, partial [Cyanobacteriota bacterium]|nr:tetratricopeptide repeat protein [Cyanobacteriota bacterium]
KTDRERLDLVKAGDLTFKEPDHHKYPCMNLAYAAGRAGGLMPAVLNAANEQAVALFLDEKIGYLDIARCIEYTCDRFTEQNTQTPALEDILEADRWARQEVVAASRLLGGQSSVETVVPEKSFHALGVERAERGDYSGAIRAFNEQLKHDPESASTYLSRGIVRSLMGDPQGAIADYTYSIRLDLNQAQAFYNRGNARQKLRDFQGAIADYNQALQMDANYAAAYYNRARTYGAVGQSQKAIADTNIAINLFLEQGDTNNYQKAVEYLDEIETRVTFF